MVSISSNPKSKSLIRFSARLAEKLNGTVLKLEVTSVSKALLQIAHEKHITKLVIGHPKRTKLQRLFRGSTTNKFLEQAKDIQIIVVPYDSI